LVWWTHVVSKTRAEHQRESPGEAVYDPRDDMRILFLLSGLALGAFAMLIGQNLGVLTPGTRPGAHRPRTGLSVAESADPAARSARRAKDPASIRSAKEALLLEMAARKRTSLEPLAALLDEAVFMEDWGKVEAAADAIREKGASWTAPPPAPPAAPVMAEPEERSLAELERELRNRREEARLARRQNRAIDIARKAEPGWREQLFELLRTGGGPGTEREARFDAAWLLARTGDEAVVKELVRLLSDPTSGVSGYAAAGLAREDYASGLAELERLARPGGDPKLRASAMASLGDFPSVQGGAAGGAVSLLVQALRAETDGAVWNAAVESLGKLDFDRVPEGHAALVEAITAQGVPGHRYFAIGAATSWRAGDERIQEALRAIKRRLPDESDAASARALLAAIAEIGDPSCEDALTRFAATPLGNSLAAEIAAARERTRAPAPGAPAVAPR